VRTGSKPVLLVMAVLTGAMAAALLQTMASLAEEKRYALNMSRGLTEVEQALAKEVERNEAYSTMLDNYQQLVLSYQETAAYNLTGVTYLHPNLTSASVTAPAVMTVSSRTRPGYEYVGVITELSLEMAPGKGRVLVSTDPLMGEVFQDTAILAKETAEKISGKSLGNCDLIFSISAPAEIPAVDGPSAGAAMCLLVLSLVEHQPISSDISLTGTIEPDGTIGAIGGLAQKAQAAKDAGATTFLVSEENSQMTITETRTVSVRGRTRLQTGNVQVNTEDYIEANIGIDVELVANMEELLDLAALAS
jgi:predicted S18 family serine protease